MTADLPEKFIVTGSIAVSAGNGRRSSASARATAASTMGLQETLVPGDTSFVYGFAIRFTALPGSGSAEMASVLDPTGAYQLSFCIKSDGFIEIRRGTSSVGTVLATSASALAINTQYYLEWKATIHNSTGSCSMQINGSASGAGASGVDTQNSTTTANWARYKILDSTTTWSATIDIDDVYILDGTGSTNNFLGDCQVDAHDVTADGANTGSTPSAGSRFQNVDDAAPDDDTTYNSMATAALKDTFVIQNLIPTGQAIIATKVNWSAKKTDAGVGTICPVLRHGTTDYDGTTQGVPTAYTAMQYQVYENNPGTSAQMTESEFNNLEVGYKRVA